MLVHIWLFLALVSNPLENLVSQGPSATKSQERPSSNAVVSYPDYSQIDNICAMVNTQSEDPDPKSPFLFLYQAKIHAAAGVDLLKDSPEVIKKKIQALWAKFEPRLICDAFGLQKGSVIKFAIDKNFDTFIEDVASWGVNLNKVDQDGLTALDYIEDEQSRPNSDLILANLRNYKSILIRAGAKRCVDLTSTLDATGKAIACR